MIVRTHDDSSSRTEQDVWMLYGMNQKSFTVDIQSCAEARLQLHSFPSESRAYEIIIGADGNLGTSLYRGVESPEAVLYESTPDVLSCLESRTFWISWDNGQIDVGVGDVSGRRLLSWVDSEPMEVHSMALSSGPGSDGAEWVYPINSGKN